MTIYRLDAHEPAIDASARVAESASVIGQVVLAAGGTTWPITLALSATRALA